MDTHLEQPRVPWSDLEELIRQLGIELNWPKNRYVGMGPQTLLDRDLGLDSLTRVELVGRIERRFNVDIGEKAFLQMESIGDLLNAISCAKPLSATTRAREQSLVTPRPIDLSEISIPNEAETLADVLDFYVTKYPQRIHLSFYATGTSKPQLTYKDLSEGARQIACGLTKLGVRRGDVIAIMLPTGPEYFFCFLGIIISGCVPVPIYPPHRPSQLEEHLSRHAKILSNCSARILVTEAPLAGTIGRLLKFGAGVNEVTTAEQLMRGENKPIRIRLRGDDVAFLQYTSGSTGNPKGVILSHANLLANIRAMGEVLEAGPKDIFVSWLPLYHDMGLIGAWLGSLYFGSHFVVMSPFAFLSRPIRWLEAITKFNATLTAAPNFAYELCVRHVADEELSSLDLSSLRVMCNGAEAVYAKTVREFTEKFMKSGLHPSAVLPVYGLAESSVGLSFPKPGKIAQIDTIKRPEFEISGVAIPAPDLSSAFLHFVGCGQALPGHEIRIVDDLDQEVRERKEGHIQFGGPSATRGYLNRPEENLKLFHGNWIDTGDLGYFARGDLFVSGRVKDMIKHAGRNVHPEELEMLIGGIAGIRKGCVVVFGSFAPDTGTERLIVVAETRETDPIRSKNIVKSINERVVQVLGGAPEEVVLVPPHAVLKTSSGKIRRSACKALFEAGRLSGATVYSQLEVIKYLFGIVKEKSTDKISAYIVVLRSAAVWVAVVFIISFFWPLMILLPFIQWRWWVCGFCAKIALMLGRVRLHISSQPQADQCIYVSNHASYLDVAIIVAAFRDKVTFVAKSELKKNIGVKLTLDRLGVIYVERYDLARSLKDAKETTEAARSGATLFSFPEGTFTRQEGLMPFHLGPFLTAAELELPIVPVAIRGTRSILRPDSWILRPGDVFVVIGDRIDASTLRGENKGVWARALSLRDKARADIMKNCGERDLMQS